MIESSEISIFVILDFFGTAFPCPVGAAIMLGYTMVTLIRQPFEVGAVSNGYLDFKMNIEWEQETYLWHYQPPSYSGCLLS